MGFEKEICAAFCGALEVHPVPTGYAVSSAFLDSSGDRLTFYITETPDGFRLEDDGDYLATLAALDLPFDVGARAHLLDAILSENDAFWDRETLEIRSSEFPREQLAARAIGFMSSIIRARDLALITRERVKSAFRDDVLSEIAASAYADQVIVEENIAPSRRLQEFPADIVLRPKAAGGKTASIYLASSNDKLNEALLAWREYGEKSEDIAVVAMLEHSDMRNLSKLKFQRAQNRGLPMPIFRGDEGSAVDRLGKQMGIASLAA